MFEQYSVRRGRAMTIPALLVVLGLGLGGCGSDSENGGGDLLTPSAEAQTIAVPGAGDLLDGLDVTPEQRTALEGLLAAWRERHEARIADRERGVRSFGPDGIRPMREFLAGAAGVLEPARMVDLIENFSAWRGRSRPERGEARGPRSGHPRFGKRGEAGQGGFGGGDRDGRRARHEERMAGRQGAQVEFLTQFLHLDVSQAAQVEVILSESRAAMREFFQSRPHFGDDAERTAFRERVTEHRAAVKEKLDAVLTREQRAVHDALAALRPEPGRGHGPGR